MLLLLTMNSVARAQKAAAPDCEAVRRSIPPGYVLEPGPCSEAQAIKPTPPSAWNPADNYLQRVMHDADVCRTSGVDAMECFVKASPERCKQSAIQFVSQAGAARRTWVMCVRSCAAANFYARHFGDCKRS